MLYFKTMKKYTLLLGAALLLLAGCENNAPIEAEIAEHPTTFCNPINISYRFMKIPEGKGIREAADPAVTYFKGNYYLFASKSSGYWYSDDCNDWKHVFISDDVMPIEDYAPGIFVHKDYIYMVGSTHGKGMLYRSARPEKGEWELVKEIYSFWDPAFYVEGDNLYMYYGCSPVDPIYAQVLDLNTLEERSKVIPCFNSDQEIHGWERPGEHNELTRRPYIEGAWMTEHNGKYYLQYAGPGTEWKSYADGVYVGDTPMGPFTYAPNNPVSYKPGGFIGGAGHGCLFYVGENYWKAATNAITVRHMFERRISLYPTYFDADDYLYSDTYLGDYPMFLPTAKAVQPGQTRPEWMLLSYGKEVTASSSLDTFRVASIVDEDARTAWVANTNGKEEWVQIDLEKACDIYAIQVNFDEYGADQSGYVDGVYQSYKIYASNNAEDWYPVVNYSTKKTDMPHDYIEFKKSFKARYIKFQNEAYTVSSNLSLRELRVFGNGGGEKPVAVKELKAERDGQDPCKVSLTWNPVADAQGYIIRYGVEPDKLYSNFQVINESSLTFSSLNKGVPYYFTIDVYNENGVTKSCCNAKID